MVTALEIELPSAVVNRISVGKLEEMLTIQHNHDFNEKNIEKKEMSREDSMFLETMEHSAVLQDGKILFEIAIQEQGSLSPQQFCSG